MDRGSVQREFEEAGDDFIMSEPIEDVRRLFWGYLHRQEHDEITNRRRMIIMTMTKMYDLIGI